MKKTAARILTLALAVIMLAGLMITASAAAEPIAYDGDSVSFIKADGSAFGMLAPQDGTTAGISGDRVYIHLIPKNTTVYTSLHFGAIDDPDLTGGVPLNAEGTGYDLDFPIDLCGKAIPVAPVKADGGTTKDQYYLAIPAKDKLDVLPIPPAPEAPAYDGDAVNFVKEDGSSFGMFEAQEGTTAALDGDNVVIHYVPKNKTVYNAIHFGPITDAELTKDVSFNTDGTFDITLSKDRCGTLIAVAPIKAKDGATTADQYYLAVPAADKLAAAAPVEQPPVEQPPVEQPPVEQPPVEQPAADSAAYTVKRGDCLWNISYRYYGTGRYFGDIAAANGIKAPYLIFAGQVLVIPAK